MKQIMLTMALSLLIIAQGNSHTLPATNKASVTAKAKRATVVTVTVSLISPGIPAVAGSVKNLATGQIAYTSLFLNTIPPTASAQLSVSEGDIVVASIQILGTGVFGTPHTVSAAEIAAGSFTVTI